VRALDATLVVMAAASGAVDLSVVGCSSEPCGEGGCEGDPGPAVGCARDQDCPVPLYCDPAKAACVVCFRNEQCGFGYTCTPGATCALASGCSGDPDCDGLRCDSYPDMKILFLNGAD